MNKKKSKIFLMALIFAVIFTSFILIKLTATPQENSPEIEAFAKCLTEKGAVMYGTFWCSHCLNTKKKFQDSFEYINYIECAAQGENEQSELCIKKNIPGYPTWEFNEDSTTRIFGKPSFEELAEKTGCEVPKI
jgi:hypothetical protein